MTKKTKISAFPLSPGRRSAGWLYTAFQFLALPAALSALGEIFGGFDEALSNFLFYLSNALAFLLILRPIWHRSLTAAGHDPLKLMAIALGCFCLLLGANQLTTALVELVQPGFSNANNAAISRLVLTRPVLMTIGTVVLVPIAEEGLFRALIFGDTLHESRRLAYALSVLGFAGGHVLGYLGQLSPLMLVLSFLQYLPAGLVLCLSMELSGSLLAPVLIHSAMNLASVLSLFEPLR